MVWKLKGLTFASVKGAGHMVPRNKREAAYVLIDSFLYSEGLPEKDVSEWFNFINIDKYNVLINFNINMQIFLFIVGNRYSILKMSKKRMNLV